jgi:HB1, ASXL, restriction endonuclease HTH domain
MTTEFAKTLRAKREEVAGTIDKMRRQIAGLSEELAVREAQMRNLDELLRLEAGAETAAERKGGMQGGEAKPIDAAEQMLRDVGRPMHYQELAKMLQAGGVFIPGKNPAANLLTQMTRDRRFRKTGRGIYAVTRRAGGDGA